MYSDKKHCQCVTLNLKVKVKVIAKINATMRTEFAIYVCNILELWLLVVKQRIFNAHM